MDKVALSHTNYGKIFSIPEYEDYYREVQYNHSDSKILWNHFFSTYFPYANNEWEKLSKDAASGESFEARYYYQDTYNKHLATFSSYLQKQENVAINEKYTSGTEQEKVKIWEDFLKNKTDIILRYKTVYLWIFLDLLEITKKISDTLLNKASSNIVNGKAQRAILARMKDIQLEQISHVNTQTIADLSAMAIPDPESGNKVIGAAALFAAFPALGATVLAAQGLQYIPPVFQLDWVIETLIHVQDPFIIDRNASKTRELQYLKAYDQRIKQNASAKNEDVNTSLSTHSKQNTFIKQMIQQLEQVLKHLL
jgi:hypothetical protein